MRDIAIACASQAPSAMRTNFALALGRDCLAIRALWTEKTRAWKGNPPDGLPDTYTYYEPWSPELEAKLLKLNALGYGIYWLANDPGGLSFKEIEVKTIDIVYRDHDRGEDPSSLALADGTKIPPHLHYITSPGKSQSAWLIEPIDAGHNTKIHGLMVDWHGHDKATGGSARLLRFPGFMNNNYPDRPLVRSVACHAARIMGDAIPASIVKKYFGLKDAKPKTAIASIMHRVQSGNGGKSWSDKASEDASEDAKPEPKSVVPTPELVEEALKLTDMTDNEVWKYVSLACGVLSKITGDDRYNELCDYYSEKNTTQDNYQRRRQQGIARDANPDHTNPVNFGTIFHYAKVNGFDQHKAQDEILRRMYEGKKANDRKAAAIEIAEYAARRDVIEFINSARLNALFAHMAEQSGIKAKDIRSAFREKVIQVCAEEHVAGDELGPDQSVDTYMAQKVYDIENMLAGPQGFFIYGEAKPGLWTRVSKARVNQLVTLAADNLVPTGAARIKDDKGNAEFTPVLEARTESTITRIAAMVYGLAHEEGLTMDRGEEFAVNCPNGEITWVPETLQFELRPHNRDHRRTTQIPVIYDPNAEAPTFKRALHSWFEGDEDAEDKRRALLEGIGYTLFPTVKYERIFIPYGKRGSGKSKLIELLGRLLGEGNYSAIAPDKLHERFMRAQLHGKLANISSETPKGSAFPADVMKRIASGDADQVEHKGGDPFTLKPFATIWSATNELPSFRDHSYAFTQRITLLGFNRMFRDTSDQIRNLGDELAKELPGILNMVLQAFAVALFRDALTEPQSSKDAKAKWELATNSAARFVDDECITAQDKAFTATKGEATETKLIYSAYKEWCGDEGISRRLEKTGFTQALLNLGFEPTKLDCGTKRAIKGLKLRNGVDFESVQSRAPAIPATPALRAMSIPRRPG